MGQNRIFQSKMDVRSAAAAAESQSGIKWKSTRPTCSRVVFGINQYLRPLSWKWDHFYFTIFTVTSPKRTLTDPRGFSMCEKKIMICTSNYMLIDPVNQNLTSVRRLEGPFFDKGPFYDPEGPIFMRLHISIWVSKYRLFDLLCPFLALSISFE